MAREFSLHPLALGDMERVLGETLALFGPHQFIRYESLTQRALAHIIEHPSRGRPLPFPKGFLFYRLKWLGQNASHRFIYRVAADGTVQVLRFLHDRMIPAKHIPGDIG
jgi:plasmid stabilization system protein ParE